VARSVGELPPDRAVKLSKSGHYPVDNALLYRLSGWKKAVNEKEYAGTSWWFYGLF
jgi:hypothetical protein